MAENKKYYWLKLKTDFFNQREVKKLRKIAGGDTYTIIYLKLQLLCTKTDGVIKFEGTEKTLAEQLELELDEDMNNIQVTLSFLEANGLIEQINDNDFLMPKVCESIGKEGSSAERVRRHRGQKALQCNTIETKCNTEIEIEKEIEKERREEAKKIPPLENSSKEKLKEIIQKENKSGNKVTEIINYYRDNISNRNEDIQEQGSYNQITLKNYDMDKMLIGLKNYKRYLDQTNKAPEKLFFFIRNDIYKDYQVENTVVKGKNTALVPNDLIDRSFIVDGDKIHFVSDGYIKNESDWKVTNAKNIEDMVKTVRNAL